MKVLRDSAGQHFAEAGHQLDTRIVSLRPATQNPDTGRWRMGTEASEFTITEAALAEEYTEVPAEPLRDPRITRLAGLVEQLLAEHEQATGRPVAVEAEIRAVLGEVALIPEEWSRRRRASVSNALRARR